MNLGFVLLILFAISLVINTVGFRYFVHFVSIGYAFSIVGMGLAALLIFRAQINLFAILQITGLLIWGIRLGVFVLRREARPSYQKEKESIQKQYGWVRCPNYLGEILVWLGGWVMAIPCYADLWQWLGSLIGFACVALIMLGSTKRLEVSQGERHGELTEYQTYIYSVPVLFPFLPIYTLKNVRAVIG
jgi:steroid 5-alpha reductase family enzyme